MCREASPRFRLLSTAEASMHFLGPALLDYIANDHVESGSGNPDRHCAPRGVYPCAGEDSWIAIACTTDEQWRALSALIDGSEKRNARLDQRASFSRSSSLAERPENQDPLDRLVGNWTRSY
jgi:benzylsuccinate CoA-transferase BbsF subunit